MKADLYWIDGLVPNTANWEFSPNVFEFRSPYTNGSKVIENMGHLWTCSFNFINLTQSQHRSIRLLEALSQAGTKSFSIPMFGYKYQGVSEAKEPKVEGAGQEGFRVNTSGWRVSQKVLSAGDMIGINGELKTVVKDVNTNPEGKATIEFYPPLRESPPTTSNITYNPPLVTMRRVIKQPLTNEFMAGNAQTGCLSAVSIGFEEVIY